MSGSFIVGAATGACVAWCVFSTRRVLRFDSYATVDADIRVAARRLVAIANRKPMRQREPELADALEQLAWAINEHDNRPA